MSAPRVAIVIYTMYGHVAKMAEAVKAGMESAGGTVSIFQIAETLPQEVLAKMHAPPKPAYPLFEPKQLAEYDALVFGVPTRFGNMPAQVKAFWDATGQLWAAGALQGRYVGAFCATGTPGGGQEVTILSMLSTWAAHGMVYVPLGYKFTFGQASNLAETHGGGPWGAGTFAGADGSRQPSELELTIAKAQGKMFWETVARVSF